MEKYIQIIPVILLLLVYILLPLILGWNLLITRKISVKVKFCWIFIILITNFLGLLGCYIYLKGLPNKNEN